MAHELPALPYAFDALEPHIDAKTMEIHHDKHHAVYVTNLNKALEGNAALGGWSLDEVCKKINDVPEAIRTAVRNNGGGHWNHSMFWKIMKKGGGSDPKGPVGDAIKSSFESFAAFKEKFNAAGMGRFGSGWAWLVKKPSGALEIRSTGNAEPAFLNGDAPLLTQVFVDFDLIGAMRTAFRLAVRVLRIPLERNLEIIGSGVKAHRYELANLDDAAAKQEIADWVNPLLGRKA